MEYGRASREKNQAEDKSRNTDTWRKRGLSSREKHGSTDVYKHTDMAKVRASSREI
jgi:hypothetical protein